MRNKLLGASVMMALIAFPVATFAQSGAATGAAAGAAAAGAAGGPAGAAVGAGVGAVAGGLTDANRPKFRQYVTTQKRPSYAYKEKVVVGAKLPTSGVTYYEVPQEYGVTKYRYTVVNERPVLVDPGTHTIVQVID